MVESSAPLSPQELVERRHRFIARLYRLLGERRIDILIAPAGVPDDRAIIRVARRDGRVLTRVPG